MRAARAAVVAAAGKPGVFGMGKSSASEQQSAADAADRWTARLRAAAQAGDGAALGAALGEHPYKKGIRAAMRAGARVEAQLVRCGGCGRGELVVTLAKGQGAQAKRSVVAVEPISPDAMQAI
jgi:hypothetical protein